MTSRQKRNWTIKHGEPLTELDKKILSYQNKGILVPRRDMIKTPEQIEGIRRSGVVNTGVLDLVEQEIRAGMTTADIDKLVYDYTVSHGAIPAPRECPAMNIFLNPNESARIAAESASSVHSSSTVGAEGSANASSPYVYVRLS